MWQFIPGLVLLVFVVGAQSGELDDTPGCTAQACAFCDDFRQLQRMQVAVLGISLDSVASHQVFAEKHGLPFPLLADENGTVAAAYGALW